MVPSGCFWSRRQCPIRVQLVRGFSTTGTPIQSDTKSSADLWISFRMPGFTKNSLLGCWIPALLSQYCINGQYDWYKAPKIPIQGLRMESGWLA